jgi:hypothetical protein
MNPERTPKNRYSKEKAENVAHRMVESFKLFNPPITNPTSKDYDRALEAVEFSNGMSDFILYEVENVNLREAVFQSLNKNDAIEIIKDYVQTEINKSNNVSNFDPRILSYVVNKIFSILETELKKKYPH